MSTHRSHLSQLVNGKSSAFISGLDLEAHWLAEAPFDGALLPSAAALRLTRKPAIPAARALPFRVPESIAVSLGHNVVYEFCASHGWEVWLKGPAYDARRVRAWSELEIALAELEETWGPDCPFFVQQHISGWEGSVAFSAFRGELLQAVSLEKRLITTEGKTWAGAVSSCEEPLRSCLRNVVQDLEWTGGGELEFVRTPSLDLWLIDWNPRFPAWIHGATTCGWNLPAELVARAFDIVLLRGAEPSRGHFTRVVLETPVRTEFPLPPPPERCASTTSKKHPSGMPLLMRRADGPFSDGAVPDAVGPARRQSVDHGLVAEILQVWERTEPTPTRVFLPVSAGRRFNHVASQLRRVKSACGLEFRPAYSIKTNPDHRLLFLAKEAGYLAEAISADEVAWAVSCGFAHSDIIYNGPIPAATALQHEFLPLHAVFADSNSSLALMIDSNANVGLRMGARIRVPGVRSRFGIEIEKQAEFERMCSALQAIRRSTQVGLSFHVQSSVVGLELWRRMATTVVETASAIQAATGREVEVLDLGGGWTSSGLDSVLATKRLETLAARIRNALPCLRTVLLEPGKAVAETAFVVVSRVLEVRGVPANEIVVDASISELPQTCFKPHPIYHVDGNDRVSVVSTGRGRILGRLCMEDDVVARRVALPEVISSNDFIIFALAGAYDTSMAYAFGRGAKSIKARISNR